MRCGLRECAADHIDLRGGSQFRVAALIRHGSGMPIRLRKFLGTIALLALVTVWALLAMALAQVVLTSNSTLAQIVYYVTAGLGWVLPAMPLISWMSRPDTEPR